MSVNNWHGVTIISHMLSNNLPCDFQTRLSIELIARMVTSIEFEARCHDTGIFEYFVSDTIENAGQIILIDCNK